MRSPSHPGSYLMVALAATAFISTCRAQEIASLDLTKVDSHVDLRRPKATPRVKSGYSSTHQTTNCPDSTRNAGSLRTTLLSLDRTHYQFEDEPKFEVTIENTGSTPMRIPFWPQLADLQPENPAQKFGYSELHITLWIAAGDHWSANTGGGVTLYGAEDHKKTMLTLEPGEWVRVIGKGHLYREPDVVSRATAGSPVDQAYAQVSLYLDEMITAQQSTTVSFEACIAQTRGRSIPIELTVP